MEGNKFEKKKIYKEKVEENINEKRKEKEIKKN